MIQVVITDSPDSTMKLGVGELSENFLKEILPVEILKMRFGIIFLEDARKTYFIRPRSKHSLRDMNQNSRDSSYLRVEIWNKMVWIHGTALTLTG